MTLLNRCAVGRPASHQNWNTAAATAQVHNRFVALDSGSKQIVWKKSCGRNVEWFIKAKRCSDLLVFCLSIALLGRWGNGRPTLTFSKTVETS
jgi:hypothetical protein